jgi:hypothetical protein
MGQPPRSATTSTDVSVHLEPQHRWLKEVRSVPPPSSAWEKTGQTPSPETIYGVTRR